MKPFRETDAPVRAFSSTPLRYRETKTQACFPMRFTERYRLFTGERFALLVVRVRFVLNCTGGLPAAGGIHCNRVGHLSASSNSRLQGTAVLCKTLSPAAVVARFAKPSLATIVRPPLVWHAGRRGSLGALRPPLNRKPVRRRPRWLEFGIGEASQEVL